MVILLVIVSFAAFILVDWARTRRRAAALIFEGDQLHRLKADEEPQWVAGFELPPSLHYHPGHTWVHWDGGDTAFIGIDDFGRRLIGKDTQLSMPTVGAQLEQGSRAIRLTRNEQAAWLLSPVRGEVVGLNPRLESDSELMHKEPYGRGWLFKIKSQDMAKSITNLLNGSLARSWMEEARDRFQRELMLATEQVIQDGGTPVDDIAADLAPGHWQSFVEEFLTLKRSS